MLLKTSVLWVLFSLVVVGIAFSPINSFFLNLDLPIGTSSVAADSPINNQASGDLVYATPFGPIQPVAPEARPGLPVRLKIPKINIDARLESVGLTPKGAVGVPKVFANAAWFNLGPRPGENGNAIIDGHFGWINGIPVVFTSLRKLRIGDKVYVEDDKGATTTFVVRESRIYDPKADTTAVFGSGDGKAHLNLITCGGTWDAAKQSYPERLVVFTDKEVE